MEQQTLLGQQGMDRPLASRMRPRTLEEFAGQRHLLGEGKVLRRLSRELPVPLIAGGLLSDKADVLASLGAGALCVSASDESLWAL